jgi:hypothetical protein
MGELGHLRGTGAVLCRLVFHTVSGYENKRMLLTRDNCNGDDRNIFGRAHVDCFISLHIGGPW